MGKIPQKPISIHELLAHSYLVFFIFFFIGIVLEIFLTSSFNFKNIGFGYFCLIIGTIFIFWAQNTSKSGKKDRIAGNISVSHFLKGPYIITRTPTHLGMLLATLGVGFIWGSIWIILTSIFSYFLTKFTFVVKEEKILVERYGQPYLEYKKKIKI